LLVKRIVVGPAFEVSFTGEKEYSVPVRLSTVPAADGDPMVFISPELIVDGSCWLALPPVSPPPQPLARSTRAATKAGIPAGRRC
jgi:hypothetical protein